MKESEMYEAPVNPGLIKFFCVRNHLKILEDWFSQHFLYLRPLPQGQGSLRPIFPARFRPIISA